jgi:hypothetical protein
VIEAVAALRQFLRIYDERESEVTPNHRPAVFSVFTSLERTAGSARDPAYSW